jgi:hypothetical protein
VRAGSLAAVSRRLLIALGVVVFLVVSVFVARWLTTEGAERSAIHSLLQDEAKGDTGAVIADLDGCAQEPACVSQVRRAVARTHRAGSVKILRTDSATAYALGESTGRTRVAWAVVDEGFPVVQCVTVKRAGNALFGRKVVLERLSLPISNTGTC